MLQLLNKLYMLRLGPNTPDADRCAKLLMEELPFRVHKFPAMSEHNGWVVPKRWHVEKAEIRKDGELIFDGLCHPMAVISSSDSFQGTVDLTELKDHLFYRESRPNAHVYHLALFYRPWENDWGFCMPWIQVKALEDGVYEVDLRTVHEDGTMKVCDYVLPGESTDTIVFNAHNCHGGMANDDMSGVVVGVEVMKRLARRSQRRYTYRLVIGAENIATAHFLGSLPDAEVETLKWGLFLEGLGNDHRLAIQQTFNGDSDIDRAAIHHLRQTHPDVHVGKFRQVIGNDETVWEAPGYEVPFASLSRSILGGIPFPEYHTSDDNIAIMSEEKLEEAAAAVVDICNILETNQYPTRRFKGMLALSNPKYDLYQPMIEAALRPTLPAEKLLWNYLMVRLPRLMDGTKSVLEIAIEHDLPYGAVLQYIKRFAEKGLVELVAEPVQT